jgi:hypothetical protein
MGFLANIKIISTTKTAPEKQKKALLAERSAVRNFKNFRR